VEKEKKHIKWAFQHAKGARHYLYMLSILSAITAAASLAMTYFTIDIVDTVIGETEGSIIQLILWSTIALAVLCITLYIRVIFFHKSANITLYNIRSYLVEKVYTRSYKKIQNKHSAELMTVGSEDVRAICNFFPSFFEEAFSFLSITIMSIVMMFLINWEIALVVTGMIFASGVIMHLFSPLLEKRHKEFTEKEQDTRKNLQESFMHIFLFKSFFMISNVLKKHKYLSEIRMKFAVRMGKYASVVSSSGHVVNTVMSFIVYILGGVFLANGRLSVGELLAILALRGNLNMPIYAIVQYANELSSTKAAVSRVREVTELPEETTHPSTKIKQISKLSFENISFSYDEDYSDEEAVLCNNSLEFVPGRIIGIAGESGSGKSTLTKLIMGFYDPNKGAIKLTDTEGNATQNILPYISYVPPTNYVFNGTIAENICMIHEMDKDKMKQVSIASGIHEFIMSLPESYDTVIGEGATELSSGQGQRVAIARALYQDSPIMIFDEPTSNLDKDSIDVIHNTMKRISKNKMCIVITHDEVTKDICDEIYLIEDGSISSKQKHPA